MKMLFTIVTAWMFFSPKTHEVPVDWIVQLDHNYTARDLGWHGAEVISQRFNLYLVPEAESSFVQKLHEHKSKGIVRAFIKDRPIEKRAVPNDFLFDQQWAHRQINIEPAWNETTGGTNIFDEQIVQAVLDDGYSDIHLDLVDNSWMNPAEIPGDGVDNDGNGFTDDINGANVITKDGIHQGLLHGTQVVGIMGAKGNNGEGIAGITWDTQLLYVSGVTTVGRIFQGYEYLMDLKEKYLNTGGEEGANIVVNNLSGGISYLFPEDFPVWCEYYDAMGNLGILSVTAVSNDFFDVEIDGDLPTLCSSEFLLTVTSTDQNDQGDSAFGSMSVDIGAPGSSIVTTEPGNDYGNISGSSASAPQVTGTVALLYSVPCENLALLMGSDPPLAARAVKSAIMSGVDKTTSLDTRSVSGGRLNVFNAIIALEDICGSSDIGALEITKLTLNNASGTLEAEYKTDVFSTHRYYVFDALGRLVVSEEFQPQIFASKTLQIDHLILSQGIYYFTIEVDGEVATRSFVSINPR